MARGHIRTWQRVLLTDRLQTVDYPLSINPVPGIDLVYRLSMFDKLSTGFVCRVPIRLSFLSMHRWSIIVYRSVLSTALSWMDLTATVATSWVAKEAVQLHLVFLDTKYRLPVMSFISKALSWRGLTTIVAISRVAKQVNQLSVSFLDIKYRLPRTRRLLCSYKSCGEASQPAAFSPSRQKYRLHDTLCQYGFELDGLGGCCTYCRPNSIKNTLRATSATVRFENGQVRKYCTQTYW